MKKLSISFFALLLIFAAGNAFAGAPNCGLWLGGEGTFSQSMDTAWNNTGFAASANCTIGTANPRKLWAWTRVATSCDETRQSTLYGVVYYPDPWFPPALMLQAEHATRSESGVPSAIGTMQVVDYRNVSSLQVLTADIIQTDGRAITLWAPGNYGPTQAGPSGCAYWHGATPTTQLPDITLIENRVVGVIQGAAEYTELVLWGDFVTDVMTMNPNMTSGHVKNMRIEIRKPVRADLDKSGALNIGDFNIFKADFNKGAAAFLCTCGNYWN